MTQINAPFSPEQIYALNQFQTGVNEALFFGHPFTCPHGSDGISYEGGQTDESKATHGKEGGRRGVLVATSQGWVCPHCTYTQDWAHTFMSESANLPKEVSDASEHVLKSLGKDATGILIQRVETAIEQYVKLYVSHRWDVKYTPQENKKTSRIWAVSSVMLASLRRRRLELMGVTIKPGDPTILLSIDASWTDIKAQQPVNGSHVLVLMRSQPVVIVPGSQLVGGISNPVHAGYGCNFWTETWIFDACYIFLFEGYPSHWKVMPASAATDALKVSTPAGAAKDLSGWTPVNQLLPERAQFCDWLITEREAKKERWILCGKSIATASVPGNATHWRPAQSLP